MRSVRTLLCGFAALAAIGGIAANRAEAIIAIGFNATEAEFALTNTIPDNDLYAITQYKGVSLADVLNTTSTDTPTGFAETLTGSYLGKAVSITYTGDATAYPGGAITWNTTGTFGTNAVSGSGSAQFAFPTASTFTVYLQRDPEHRHDGHDV